MKLTLTLLNLGRLAQSGRALPLQEEEVTGSNPVAPTRILLVFIKI